MVVERKREEFVDRTGNDRYREWLLNYFEALENWYYDLRK